MGKATSAALRLEVATTHIKEKLGYSALAKRFNLSYNTVRSICTNYEKEGVSSLTPDYSKCGRKTLASSEKAYRLVRLVYHYHRDWGIPYIVTRIKRAFPDLELQSVRHYQRRIASKRLNYSPPPVVPKVKFSTQVRTPHDEWQIDAKERIILPSGQEVCYLNITDKKTHALLKVKPFSPRQNQFSSYSGHHNLAFGFV